MSTDTVPSDPNARLSETQVPPSTAEEASQRHNWPSEGYGLPPTTDKPPYGPVEPTPSHREPVAKPLSKHTTHLLTLSYLVFFSILGTLARLGLQALTIYPGAPVVTGVTWANVGGSLLMGFFLEDKNLFREEWGDTNRNNNNDGTRTNEEDPGAEAKRHRAIKKTIPLYIGLTTGFCGCFTSFSSFIRDIFLALSNDLSDPSTPTITSRNGGYSFMAVLAVILTTVALSLGALIFGAHLALALGPLTPSFPFRFTRRFLDPPIVLLSWGCWLGAIFLAIWPPDRHNHSTEVWRGRAVFAIVFTPLGCFLRYYLSLALNARLPVFPLGTFAVNILGTVILAMCFDLQRVDGVGASPLGPRASYSILTSCQVLAGVMDGFCGSATTISTWVAELNGLSRRRYAYFYGIVSIGVALGFFVIITGSLRWTRGFGEPVCD
ncbi:CrcB-like protein-domain-containing protein [Aspergillus alliaceus]|uniref:CrcB-like protein-domain-containing protein n=1 Tax=Petromyces alliaceus TaxID=209559 RepID=A0A5N7CN35_PETAA|nr:CrcB-like protein-domain-containing protein [Aspergillus alliaceus]KAB8239270.1 CrcB-like protein-domain-containing protein [Aspergillus alliaceus]KAE8395672.1 CrcB-like protein-domain-containing protein [Aspergillus alliaceus]